MISHLSSFALRQAVFFLLVSLGEQKWDHSCQHPNLSLAQIYGALTYYYENQGKVDEQIRRIGRVR